MNKISTEFSIYQPRFKKSSADFFSNNQIDHSSHLDKIQHDINQIVPIFPISTESVLLNFTPHRLVGLFFQADYTTFPKLEQSNLGLLQMDHIHSYVYD